MSNTNSNHHHHTTNCMMNKCKFKSTTNNDENNNENISGEDQEDIIHNPNIDLTKLEFSYEHAVKVLLKTKATANAASSALQYSKLKTTKLIPVEPPNINAVPRKIKPPSCNNNNKNKKERIPLHILPIHSCSRVSSHDQTNNLSSHSTTTTQHIIPPFCFTKSRDLNIKDPKRNFYLKITRDGNVYIQDS
jgi:hypothetical protein